jgi:hypothetical protein
MLRYHVTVEGYASCTCNSMTSVHVSRGDKGYTRGNKDGLQPETLADGKFMFLFTIQDVIAVINWSSFSI